MDVWHPFCSITGLYIGFAMSKCGCLAPPPPPPLLCVCSINSLYIGFVLVIGRFTRFTFIERVSDRIMFYELPDVDLVLQLCLNIFLVREMKDYRLEEELFSKLIFLYRSPKAMIHYTAHRHFTHVRPSGD